MRKNGFNFSVFIGIVLVVVAIICFIRFFVLLGGGG